MEKASLHSWTSKDTQSNHRVIISFLHVHSEEVMSYTIIYVTCWTVFFIWISSSELGPLVLLFFLTFANPTSGEYLISMENKHGYLWDKCPSVKQVIRLKAWYLINNSTLITICLNRISVQQYWCPCNFPRMCCATYRTLRGTHTLREQKLLEITQEPNWDDQRVNPIDICQGKKNNIGKKSATQSVILPHQRLFKSN